MNGIITFINEACDPEAGPHPTMRRPWPQTCSLQNWEQHISVVLKPPVHGIYWEQYISVVLKPPVYGISLQQLDVLWPSLGASIFCMYKG